MGLRHKAALGTALSAHGGTTSSMAWSLATPIGEGFIVVNVGELRSGDGLHTCKNALTASNTSLSDTGSPPSCGGIVTLGKFYRSSKPIRPALLMAGCEISAPLNGRMRSIRRFRRRARADKIRLGAIGASVHLAVRMR